MRPYPLPPSRQCEQAEYERVKAAYVGMSASLESLSGEKRQLEAHVARLEADNRRSDRERRCGVWGEEGGGEESGRGG